MTGSAQGRLLTDNQSLQKLGLDRSQPASWENGLRSPGVENGWFLQVAFFYVAEGDSPKTGLIDLNIAKDGKKLCDLHKRIGRISGEIVVAKGHCDLQYRKNYFRSVNGLSEYHIFVDPDEMEGFGRWDVDGPHFSWFVAVPGGQLTGEVTVNGTKTKVEGNAYHDHNWGNVPMEKILDNWLWGHADVGGLSIVSASVRFRQNCGGREVPLLFIVRGNEVLVDVSDDQLVCLEGVKIAQPDTGKPTSSDCIYLVKSAGDNLAQVRFDGQQKVIASFPYPTTSDEWETWYTRYAGLVTINIKEGNKRVYVSDHGSLEVMDFFGRRKLLSTHQNLFRALLQLKLTKLHLHSPRPTVIVTARLGRESGSQFRFRDLIMSDLQSSHTPGEHFSEESWDFG
ncbi:hypothetical protein DER46DRAFT_638147 [Fusarium sp. MPI-SDFR-AT-0072]|nr:hypothetical protein DER46DRAFT_638147 [Fusarium sp. MPI-SDFR-AT-0072]